MDFLSSFLEWQSTFPEEAFITILAKATLTPVFFAFITCGEAEIKDTGKNIYRDAFTHYLTA